MERHAKRCAVLAVLLLAVVMVAVGAATMPQPAAAPLDWQLLQATPVTAVGPLP